ncbi:tripartite tricarboxylate transporter TctB family protein [Vibrio anguillarum]|uniref:Tripartite tricarboxylate transporter TctB family protein n=5 Tax=Vibrio anguillarum TaxID=55601 RepID=A0A1Y0NXF0_VIBAN|nr:MULTISPECIES: tripartite tricarboxylate transporter TctB family protein [Vibrio]AGU58903.1 tricarboxylate transporter [Vibrio anguillarum M3]ARV27225.1 tripartite tricarboxylate transporter TctB family protein [Vibrio anguillarum]ASF91714.1 tripartite tricarboxylate transporter TctB family protein [Vibrio anguillarum]ATA49625.1 tripartite tricarboxylate transporter TctB family protein [Vibrio anguillarum]ATC57434.1 tripartite tricarboxylate transporter TctB family protein [Vibrio anguillaru
MENNKIRPNWDAFTGLFSVGFGLIYGGMTYTMPRAAFGNPLDPIYFPMGIAVLALMVGCILLAKSNMRASVMAFIALINEDEVKKFDRKRILYTCIVSVGYALIFDPLGYVISTFFFLFSMLTITSGIKAWKQSILVALAFSVCVYFVFSTLLSISLPPLPFME